MHHVEFIAAHTITPALHDAWEALGKHQAEPNIFSCPSLLLSALASLDRAGHAQLAVVRDESQNLIGVMPFEAKPSLGRIPIRTIADWNHANSFLAPICIVPGAEAEFWIALIPALQRLMPRSRALLIDMLHHHGAVHAGLMMATEELRLSSSLEKRIVRAMIQPECDTESYWEEAVRPKKRKELRRQWNRLGEEGLVELTELDAGQDVTPWIEEFLALEASGWKGANGSAIASRATTERFFRTAIRLAHQQGALCFTALRLDGRAIAMLLTLINGKAGFSFKTAFDESYARYSPGVLLQRESLNILAARDLDWIDSCAAQDHPMIDSLWRERRTIVSLSLAMPGLANGLLYAFAQLGKRVWHALKAMPPMSGKSL